MQTYDSAVSVAQPEDVLPESQPDAEYDYNVTCRTPIRYIKQKWLCKRDREVRYKVDKMTTNKFDERRLIDMRFWLYMGIISNILFQTSSTLKPITPEQFNLNMYYWVVSLILVAILILSFTWKITILNLGSIIYMGRNIIPLFDIEKREEVIGKDAFMFLSIFQTMTVMMHLMLLNNSLDKSMIVIAPLALTALFVGILNAAFDLTQEMSGRVQSIILTLLFGTFIFMLFLYLQKRIHKEVFLSYKNLQHQQNEFKVIFDQLEEGVVITAQEKLLQMNSAFKAFVSKNIS